MSSFQKQNAVNKSSSVANQLAMRKDGSHGNSFQAV